MKRILLLLFTRWTTKKPKFDHEFILITANKGRRHRHHANDGGWDYSFWLIMKCYGPDGWYYALCNHDGEEWGDRDDLAADLYKKLPFLK